MKRYIPFIVIGTILFIVGGDKVFPGAVGQMSYQVRNSINNTLMGAFPKWERQTNPYERTEKQLEETESNR
ncbi:MAG: hypothetical protein F6K62_04530 [Sphaerospermopsis sp. SIO1G2]|nr:hypothetical protein [Sphaerospermopsis sp. SIO1G1]NET70292.1 hypothetical protein [Sphaerospermopsis sp. SIO1G2]